MGYKSLFAKLQAIWKMLSSFQMIDLGYDFFVVKFADSDDVNKVIVNGPWFV